MYPCTPALTVSFRRAARALALGAAIATPVLLSAPAAASGETNLQETAPLVWVLVAIGVGGAFITFTILVYALWKFRDPTTRGRRYG
jgi:hypothetical protein